MRSYDIQNEIKRIAKRRAQEMNMSISNNAINFIIEDLNKYKNIITDRYVFYKGTKYDIFNSIKILIKEASIITKKDDRNTILSNDIEAAWPKVCPNYWPFC